MVDIQLQALKRFSANMDFFSEKDSELHKQLSQFQLSIENGSYKENFALEYLEDGYFDVKNLNDNTWLYGMNSNEFAQKKADEINWRKLDQSFSNMHRRTFMNEGIKDLEKLSPVNFLGAQEYVIEHAVTKLKGRNDEMIQIYKFAFCGIALGTHLMAIHEKIKAKSYIFFEKNIELFYLSLFVCDYTIFSNARTTFVILKNNDETNIAIDKFVSDMWLRNDFLKYSLFSDKDIDYLRLLRNYYGSHNSWVYSYENHAVKIKRSLEALKNRYKFLDLKAKFKNNEVLLKDHKLFMVALGPSLDTYIDYLKENQDNFIILTVLAAWPKLKSVGIKPDIIIHIDEAVWPIEGTFDKMEEDDFDNINFIGLSSLPWYYVNKFIKKDNCFIIQDHSIWKNDFGTISGFTVGEAALQVATYLSPKEIYLAGFDLAINQETGESHAKDYVFGRKYNLETEKEDELSSSASMSSNVVEVQGNKRDIVKSNAMYYRSIMNINSWLEANVEDQKIYNLSDHGAKFNKTKPIETDKIDLSDKPNKPSINELAKLLESISSDTMSDIEMQMMEFRNKNTKYHIKLVKNLQKAKIENKDDFYEALVDFLAWIFIAPSNGLLEIWYLLNNYLRTISGYLGEYMNTKDAITTKRSLNLLRDTIVMQLFKMFRAISLCEYMDIGDFSKYASSEIKEIEDFVFYNDFFRYRFKEFSQIDEMKFIKKIMEAKWNKYTPKQELNTQNNISVLMYYLNIFDNKYEDKIIELASATKINVLYFNDEEIEYFKNLTRIRPVVENMTFIKLNDISDFINNTKQYMANHTAYVTEKAFVLYLQEFYKKDIGFLTSDLELDILLGKKELPKKEETEEEKNEEK